FNEMVLFGEDTLYLPLPLYINEFDEDTADGVIENEIKKDVDKLFSLKKSSIAENVKKAETPLETEIVEEGSLFSSDDDFEDMPENVEETEDNELITEEVEELVPEGDENILSEDEAIVEEHSSPEEPSEMVNKTPEDDFTVSDLDFLDELEDINNEIYSTDINEDETLSENEIDDIMNEPFIDENVLADEKKEQSEDNNSIDVQEETEQPVEDNIQENVIQDENINEVEEPQEDILNVEEEEIIPDENVSESDVETQEEAEEETEKEETEQKNAESEETEQEEKSAIDDIIDNIYEDNSNQEEQETPSQNSEELTVYETDTQPSSVEELPFKVGDKVYHPKHGKGVVEGFTNYNNKITFCQIEFENVGRRILDPKVANIQKIEE
ncbi:hypothetical protein II906_03215, partial [bacterium]|nr:hypothetical protein [bacterium]